MEEITTIQDFEELVDELDEIFVKVRQPEPPFNSTNSIEAQFAALDAEAQARIMLATTAASFQLSEIPLAFAIGMKDRIKADKARLREVVGNAH